MLTCSKGGFEYRMCSSPWWGMPLLPLFSIHLYREKPAHNPSELHGGLSLYPFEPIHSIESCLSWTTPLCLKAPPSHQWERRRLHLPIFAYILDAAPVVKRQFSPPGSGIYHALCLNRGGGPYPSPLSTEPSASI